jgi:transposase InsO family protein
MAHPGVKASKRLVSTRYVWPGLAGDVAAWCRQCVGCQRGKVVRHVHLPPEQIPIPARRFTHIHVDIVGPLPPSQGFQYIFTIIDRTSRWVEAVPLANITAAACAEALFQAWIMRYGVPAAITSDRGAQFTSAVWAAMCKLLNIDHLSTTAFHPQANGMVERWHRRLKMPCGREPPPQIGPYTCPGSCWRYGPPHTTTPASPLLKQCLAYR